MVIVLPLASSNLSIVLISIIIVIPKVMMSNRMAETKIPDQIGTEVKPTQSYASENLVSLEAPLKNN